MARNRRINGMMPNEMIQTKQYKLPSHTKQYVFTPVGYKDHNNYQRTLELRDIMERINLRGKVNSKYTYTPLMRPLVHHAKRNPIMLWFWSFCTYLIDGLVRISSTKKGRKKRRVRIQMSAGQTLAVMGCLTMFAVGAYQIVDYMSQSVKASQTNAFLQEMYYSVTFAPVEATPTPAVTPEPTYMPSVVYIPEATPRPTLAPFYQTMGEQVSSNLSKLIDLNDELVGWLNIDGVVDLPVVYRDNDYYLHRDFYGDPNKAGTLFLDENHPFVTTTQYMVVHGHNMDDGSMFGLVLHYRDLDYVHKHGIMNYNTLYQPEEYVLFAVAEVSTDPSDPSFIPYLGLANFQTESQFDYFVNLLTEQSLYDIPIDVNPSDAMITLSTCLEEDRLIVVFRRVRENERISELKRSLAQSTKKRKH